MARGFCYVFFVAFFTACVGPTTPFGAIDDLKTLKPTNVEGLNPFSKKTLVAETRAHEAQISFYPDRQLLHDHRTPFEIRIQDPDGVPSDHKLALFYGDQDITRRFLNRAQRAEDPFLKRVTYKLSNLSLPPDRDHRIHVVYQRNSKMDLWVSREYEPPHCNIFAKQIPEHTEPFKPRPELINKIIDWSEHHNFNASLLAGLIAQESSFNPEAVSFSKALGLTQVTPLAQRQIQPNYQDWPVSDLVDRYPAPLLKILVASGRLTGERDWRLNVETSIRGGLSYLDYLYEYWTAPENQSLLSEKFSNPHERITEILLASYNSGAARVKKAVDARGAEYLKSDPSLNAARAYVQRVTSYCYHFAQKEVVYAKAP